jgi:hypothetical protein
MDVNHAALPRKMSTKQAEQKYFPGNHMQALYLSEIWPV